MAFIVVLSFCLKIADDKMWDIFHRKQIFASSKQIILKRRAFDIRGILIALDEREQPHNIFIFSYFSIKKVFSNHLKCLSKALLMSTTTYVFVKNRKNSHTFGDKLAISGAMYLAKYISYLSAKPLLKRDASIEFSAISAKRGNLYHSWLIQQTVAW